jgi:hypothetical protein
MGFKGEERRGRSAGSASCFLQQRRRDAVRTHRDLAEKVGLWRTEPGGSSSGAEDSNLFSIYDGTRFVFNESEWTLVTLWRMLMRYGLSYFRFQVELSPIKQPMCHFVDPTTRHALWSCTVVCAWVIGLERGSS